MLRGGAAWRRDERGAAALELIVSLPLLVGMMVLTANYGLMISTREALDSATRDATRLLTRAPAGLTVDPVTGQDEPQLYTHFLTEARQLIADRIGVETADVTLTTRVDFLTGSDALRREFYLVTVNVSVNLQDRVLLGIVDKPVFTSADSGRWQAEVDPGVTGCLQTDKDAGRCR